MWRGFVMVAASILFCHVFFSLRLNRFYRGRDRHRRRRHRRPPGYQPRGTKDNNLLFGHRVLYVHTERFNEHEPIDRHGLFTGSEVVGRLDPTQNFSDKKKKSWEAVLY